ncbi:similar to Saccharomyces cerevisiae YDR202C RAV2 Subunit of RAVE [Maudiozyma saulgeensis]|uniref:Similar to Saccharomyces cerevisiae YDR202C RAV2 Subunit of RAVE n=1 Tax=Maudiozyma saulgeensis TaxID=1789683 RepID=A0A1X7RC25_9SACH|nr:similar to Saccharomyces cerevisiae YDR202C RAV2 Subunit of RAVE [Kazachstania saulgeensis]
MSTDLYDYDIAKESYKQYIKKDHINELRWLIKDIIKPDLPYIIDEVEYCLTVLNNNEISRMPITTGGFPCDPNAPQIQGIITRQGPYILDIQFTIKFAHYKKGQLISFRGNSDLNATVTTEKYELLQLQVTNKKLLEILKNLEDLEMINDDETFVQLFEKILSSLTQLINILQNPPNELNFPFDNNSILKHFYERSYNDLCESVHHLLSLEVALSGDKFILDFRNLDKVTKRPWCQIDPQDGKSLVDKIKEQQRRDRGKKLEDILVESNVIVEEASLLNNLMQSTFNKESTTLQQAQFFISRCITFDGKVITELEKVSTSCSDQSLMNLTNKLNELEEKLGNHFNNLSI